MAQQLVKNPQLFNHKALVSTNLFMDIISEECAGLIGSIGLVYSTNIGDDYVMFEPAHGCFGISARLTEWMRSSAQPSRRLQMAQQHMILVEAGGSWWKLVEAGGSWWKREHELDDGCDHRASEEVRSRV